MIRRNHKKPQNLVMLTAGVGSYSSTTVDLAVEIALAVDTQLQGLFIEDEDLLRIAGLSCSREITLTTALERPTDVDQMQRSLRSMAEQFKSTLQQAAQASSVSWSFDYVRGRISDVVVQKRSDVTYTILGQTSAHRPPRKQPIHLRKVLFITDHSPYLFDALNIILRRFEDERVELTVVSEHLLSGDIEHGDISQTTITRTDLLSWLATTHPIFDCAIVSHNENPKDLQQILKHVSCPVILVA